MTKSNPACFTRAGRKMGAPAAEERSCHFSITDDEMAGCGL